MFRAAGLSLVIVALAASGPSAQARWAQPYERGRDAVNAGRYAEGIELLLRAISIDRRQAQVKQVEGAHSIEYYPFYFLGVAYLRTGDLEKAETAFADARSCNCLTQALSDLLQKHERDLSDLRAKAAAGRETPPGRGAKPDPTGPDPNFTRRLDDAETAMGARRWADALQLFDALRAMDGNEYGRLGLAKRRTEAARQLADALVAEGSRLLSAGELSAARERFAEANTHVPNSGQRGLDQIQQRRAEYAKQRSAAEADQAARRTDAALEKLERARAADPEQYRADGLAARAREWEASRKTVTPPPPGDDRLARLLKNASEHAANGRYRDAASLYRSVLTSAPDNAEAKAWLEANDAFERARDTGRRLLKEGQYQSARQALDDARRQNGDRFTTEGLEELIRGIDAKLGPLPEAQIGQVRSALVVLLQGDAARAATMLEPVAAASDGFDPRVRAHVHAWLAVAYAEQSMTALEAPHRDELRQRAIAEFKRLVSVQPDYQLPESLITQRVRELLDDVRVRR